jgi:hypothetical protein
MRRRRRTNNKEATEPVDRFEHYAMKGMHPPVTVEELKRQMIERLYANELNRDQAILAARELEMLWFPTSSRRKEIKDDIHIMRAKWYSEWIIYIAQTENISIHEARTKLAKLTMRSSGATLQRYLQRGRAKAEKRMKDWWLSERGDKK